MATKTAKKTSVKKTPAAKTSTKKVAKKKTAPKATKKKVVKKDTKAVPAPQETKEIKWSDKKLTLLRTLQKAQATNALAGIPKEKIAKLSKGKALTGLNPAYDITVQGYIAQAKVEDQKNMVYYVTKKGLTILKKQDK